MLSANTKLLYISKKVLIKSELGVYSVFAQFLGASIQQNRRKEQKLLEKYTHLNHGFFW